MPLRLSIFSIVVAASLSILTPPASAAVFSGLGDFPGGHILSLGYGISGDGMVATGGSSTSLTDDEAFRWTLSGGLTSIGDLPGGDHSAIGYALSGDGSVIVGSGRQEEGTRAFRWTSGGGMQDLGVLGSYFGNSQSAALGVSPDGSIVVGYSNSANGQEAFRWVSDGMGGGTMTGLGDLAGGSVSSVANDVSSDGSVVVGSGLTGTEYEAFRWTVDDGMVGLGLLGGGYERSEAMATSADGSVVVGYSGSAASGAPNFFFQGGIEAYRWTESTGMVGLGGLEVLAPSGFDPGGVRSLAWDVTADGSIIVGQSVTSVGGRAFIWDEVNGMRNLQTMLESDFGIDLSGWSLEQALSISDDGTKIIGIGTHNGETEAWYADLSIAAVPEPSSMLLCGLAATTFWWRRRRLPT